MSIKLKVRQGGASASQPDLANLAEAREGIPIFGSDGSPLIDFAQRWEQGQAGQGSYTYVDVDGSMSYFHRPHAEVKLIEDESGTDYIIGWGRMEGGNDTGRPATGPVGHGTVEHSSIQVMDCNIDLRGLPFRTAWERPAETSWQRLQALELRSLNGSSSTGHVRRATTDITINNFVGGNHLVDASDPVDMDAKTYPIGTTPLDVMEDIFSQWEGKRWGVTLHHTDSGTHKCLLVLEPGDHDTFQSALKISDVLADWSPDDPDAPVLVPEWRRGAGKVSDNSEVISGLISIWQGTKDNPRSVYVETADSEDDWETWVDVFNDDVAANETQATRRANAILNDRKRPYVTPQPSITLNPDQVTLITAGQSIEVKSVVINQGPDRHDYQWWTIAEIRWEPLPDGRWVAHLQLDRAKNAAGGNGGGGHPQPGSTTPKPAPEHVPDPGDSLDKFYNANDAGGDAENWTGLLGNQGGSGDGAAGTDWYYYKSNSPRQYQRMTAWAAGDQVRIEGYIGCRSDTGGGLMIAFCDGAVGDEVTVDNTLETHVLATNPAEHHHADEWTFFTAGPYEAPVGTTAIALGKVGGLTVDFDEISIFLVGDPAANDPDANDYGDFPHDSTHWLPSDYVEARLDDLQSQVSALPQSIRDSLEWKQSVRVATTANGTLATAFDNGSTVDGVTLATGDRILIKDQTSAVENGIYEVVASGAPTRASDFDSDSEVVAAAVVVEEGSANADKVFICTSDEPTVVGTDGIDFSALSGGGGSGHTIKEDGTPLTARAGLNFGSGIVATDDAGNNETDVDLDWAEDADVSTQAFGDAAATGTSQEVARGGHKHGMPALGTTTQPVGTAAGGSATTPSKSDHVHATGAGTPSTQAFGDAASTGTGPAAAMTDHKHAMPADPVTAHAAASDPHTGYVLESLIDAKGDLIAGTAADTVGRLPVGSDNKVLTAKSSESTGLTWSLVSDIPAATNIGWIDSASNPDKPPASPNALDDEFDAGSLDGKWTQTGGAAAPTFADSKLLAFSPSAGSTGFRQTFQPGASTAFTIRIKFIGFNFQSDTDLVGLQFLDSSNANICSLDIRRSSGILRMHKDVAAAGTDVSLAFMQAQVYLEVSRDASNVWSYRISWDGSFWSSNGMATNTTSTTVDKVNIRIETTRSVSVMGSGVDWIRRTV